MWICFRLFLNLILSAPLQKMRLPMVSFKDDEESRGDSAEGRWCLLLSWRGKTEIGGYNALFLPSGVCEGLPVTSMIRTEVFLGLSLSRSGITAGFKRKQSRLTVPCWLKVRHYITTMKTPVSVNSIRVSAQPRTVLLWISFFFTCKRKCLEI